MADVTSDDQSNSNGGADDVRIDSSTNSDGRSTGAHVPDIAAADVAASREKRARRQAERRKRRSGKDRQQQNPEQPQPPQGEGVGQPGGEAREAGQDGGQGHASPRQDGDGSPGAGITKSGLLIGVGGTGSAIVDLAIWSDYVGNEMSSDRRRSFETLIPKKLGIYNFDLSQELNSKRDKNPGYRNSGAYYLTIMNSGVGAGKVPPIGRMVGELQYELLVRQFEQHQTGQVALIAHSHSGGTGSGLAPTIAKLLTAGEEAAKKFRFPEGVRTSGYRSGNRAYRTLVSDAISIGITEEDSWPENRIYNFKNIIESFRFSIIVDVDTITATGETGRSFSDFVHGVAKNRPSPSETRAFYLENTVMPSYGESRPDYIGIGRAAGYKYAVADRYAARIIRMLGTYLIGKNISDLLNAARAGKRFSNKKSPATWALPYVWPPDGDIDPEITDRSLGYAVTRALIDGSLCNAASDFRSAESVIVLYESNDDYVKTVDHGTAQMAIEIMLGLKSNRILIERVTSLKKFSDEGLSVLVLAIGQVPKFAEDWLKKYDNEEAINELNSSVSQKWSEGAPTDDNVPGRTDSGSPEASTDTLPDVLQTGQWRMIRDRIEEDLRIQLGISSADSEDNIKSQAVLRRHLTSKMVDLHGELNKLKIWDEFKKFADETGITGYVNPGAV